MSLWVHAGCDFRRITEVFLAPLTLLTLGFSYSRITSGWGSWLRVVKTMAAQRMRAPPNQA
jgi:hypothetical protein